jgi:hypothetical protein
VSSATTLYILNSFETLWLVGSILHRKTQTLWMDDGTKPLVVPQPTYRSESIIGLNHAGDDFQKEWNTASICNLHNLKVLFKKQHTATTTNNIMMSGAYINKFLVAWLFTLILTTSTAAASEIVEEVSFPSKDDDFQL